MTNRKNTHKGSVFLKGLLVTTLSASTLGMGAMTISAKYCPSGNCGVQCIGGNCYQNGQCTGPDCKNGICTGPNCKYINSSETDSSSITDSSSRNKRSLDYGESTASEDLSESVESISDSTDQSKSSVAQMFLKMLRSLGINLG